MPVEIRKDYLVNLPRELERVIDHARQGQPPTRGQCEYLLALEPASIEAGVVRAAADAASRERFGNEAMLLGQIGIETAPCPGNCKFCVFGKEHTTFPTARLDRREILARAHGFADGDDLYALFLMTMHEFGFADLLDTVVAVRAEIPAHTQIVVNIGDFDAAQAVELRAAGVGGAYHVCRLREGVDTDLDPARRRRTFDVIGQAGLDFYYCCEPIGPEHTPAELVEQMFLGIEAGCFQHAAMRRVWLPGSPLANRGQVTELRLAQVVAVVTLAALGCPETKSIAVHEPNLLGLSAGANVVYAEAGANPRDKAADTSGHRGLDIAGCRKMLYESGFTALCRGDGTTVPLDLESLAPPETARIP